MNEAADSLVIFYLNAEITTVYVVNVHVPCLDWSTISCYF